jgi:GDP-4-dehydro-6-deoxy-D-mannose reductase
MMRRALITGAAGFVGKVLSGYLKQSAWEVVGTDCAASEDIIACDVGDRDSVEAMLDAVGEVTHVFHLAAMTFVPEAMRHPSTVMTVNLLGTINLMTALHARLPGARVVFVGSAECYGRPLSLPMDEGHSLQPENPYAISKAAADQYCAFLSRSTDMDIVRMRPFNHSGPGQSDHFVLSSFARQIAEIEAGRTSPQIHVGNLNAARDFMHVNDVVRAYGLVAEQGSAGEAYNICSGKSCTIQEALATLLGFSDRDIEVVTDPERMRPVDVPEVVGSHDKLSADTGWVPEIGFETLLKDLLGYWREQFTDGADARPGK